MEAAAHNPAFAAHAHIPVSVAKDFVQADKRTPAYKKRVGQALQPSSK